MLAYLRAGSNFLLTFTAIRLKICLSTPRFQLPLATRTSCKMWEALPTKELKFSCQLHQYKPGILHGGLPSTSLSTRTEWRALADNSHSCLTRDGLIIHQPITL